LEFTLSPRPFSDRFRSATRQTPGRANMCAAAALESLDKLDPVEAWKPWEPTAKDPWGLKWAGHLLRRAAFGATPDELRRTAADDHTSVIRRLLTGDATRTHRDDALAEEGRKIAEANNAFDMRGWWIDRMMNTHH